MTAVDLALPPPAEGTAEAAARVALARERQASRYEGASKAGRRPVNADAPSGEIEALANPDEAGRALLVDAAAKLNLTARGYHRVLKVARTIADLDAASRVGRLHIAEALSYRRREPSNAPASTRDANTARLAY